MSTPPSHNDNCDNGNTGPRLATAVPNIPTTVTNFNGNNNQNIAYNNFNSSNSNNINNNNNSNNNNSHSYNNHCNNNGHFHHTDNSNRTVNNNHFMALFAGVHQFASSYPAAFQSMIATFPNFSPQYVPESDWNSHSTGNQPVNISNPRPTANIAQYANVFVAHGFKGKEAHTSHIAILGWDTVVERIHNKTNEKLDIEQVQVERFESFFSKSPHLDHSTVTKLVSTGFQFKKELYKQIKVRLQASAYSEFHSVCRQACFQFTNAMIVPSWVENPPANWSSILSFLRVQVRNFDLPEMWLICWIVADVVHRCFCSAAKQKVLGEQIKAFMLYDDSGEGSCARRCNAKTFTPKVVTMQVLEAKAQLLDALNCGVSAKISKGNIPKFSQTSKTVREYVTQYISTMPTTGRQSVTYVKTGGCEYATPQGAQPPMSFAGNSDLGFSMETNLRATPQAAQLSIPLAGNSKLGNVTETIHHPDSDHGTTPVIPKNSLGVSPLAKNLPFSRSSDCDDDSSILLADLFVDRARGVINEEPIIDMPSNETETNITKQRLSEAPTANEDINKFYIDNVVIGEDVSKIIKQRLPEPTSANEDFNNSFVEVTAAEFATTVLSPVNQETNSTIPVNRDVADGNLLAKVNGVNNIDIGETIDGKVADGNRLAKVSHIDNIVVGVTGPKTACLGTNTPEFQSFAKVAIMGSCSLCGNESLPFFKINKSALDQGVCQACYDKLSTRCNHMERSSFKKYCKNASFMSKTPNKQCSACGVNKELSKSSPFHYCKSCLLHRVCHDCYGSGILVTNAEDVDSGIALEAAESSSCRHGDYEDVSSYEAIVTWNYSWNHGGLAHKCSICDSYKKLSSKNPMHVCRNCRGTDLKHIVCQVCWNNSIASQGKGVKQRRKAAREHKLIKTNTFNS